MDASIIRITDNLTSAPLPDRSDIGDTTIRILAREVTGRTDFQVSGRIFQNPDELFRFINRMARADIMQYTDFYLTNRKMLQQISDSFDMVTRSNFMKNIPALLPNEEQKKSSMLSFDGYVFRNVEESLRFYDAYLKYMGGIHGELVLRGHPEDIEYSSIPSIPSGFYDFRHNYRMFLRNAGFSERVLPWHTKSTLIVITDYPEMPRNAHVCKVCRLSIYAELPFAILTEMTKISKILPFVYTKSSQIVVKIRRLTTRILLIRSKAIMCKMP